MAKYRQVLQTEPVLDNSAGDEPLKIEKALPKESFQNVLKFILTSALEQVGPLRHETFQALRRLGAARDESKATFKFNKNASSQVDVGSIIGWIRGVDGTDADAVEQLIALDATCVARGG